jgi:hypothetical protein
MRYVLILLLSLLLTGCGLFGSKEDESEVRKVSARDRDLAQCEMQALESIPAGPDAEERIERHTLLCMQERGYPGTDRKMKVIIRDDSATN